MADLTIRPLVAGEENLFDSMPDPLPELRQNSYAGGVASGGYRPDNTWVALRGGRVAARAAWLQPTGAVGEPWLERFDLSAEPEVGARLLRAAHEALGGPTTYFASMPADWRSRPEVLAAVEPPMAAARLAGLVERAERIRFSRADAPMPSPSGRFEFRPARDEAEINDLVSQIAEPELLTGAETARLMRGVEMATDPLGWLRGPAEVWRVALEAGKPVGLAGPAGDACYPMIAYLGVLDLHVLGELIADAVGTLVAGGALEVITDTDATSDGVRRALEQQGFVAARSRIRFDPSPTPR